MKLRGPAHPDAFRVKVGYYRHYFDNLPGCDIAPATDATWPAVSSIKNAAGKDWSYTTMKRIATHLAANPSQYDGKPEKEIYNGLVALNKTELDRAMDRGTDVHSLLEAKAFGGDIMLTPDAEKYRAVVDQFLADCQPEFFLSEVVFINRTEGYGGTGDALCIVNHPDLGFILTDWKSRTDGDKHAAYPEECRQVGGAYFHGEYMIVEENGQAKRAAMPDLDGAAIVSLAPDSYKVIPINVEDSWTSFKALHGYWRSNQGVTFAGKPLHIPRSAPAPVDPDYVARLRKTVEWIRETSPEGFAALAAGWPDGVPTFRDGGPVDADQATLLAMLIERVDREHSVAFNPEPIPEPEPVPLRPAAEVRRLVDEGDLLDDDDMENTEDLARRLAALDAECQAWIAGIAAQAKAAGAPISLLQKPSERRYQIARGLILIAPHGEDELLRALVALAAKDDSLTQPALPAGAVVASLGATEAAAFAALCEQYAANGLPTVVGPDNRLRVQQAAGV